MMEADNRFLEQVAAVLRTDATPDADFDARVMQAVRAEARHSPQLNTRAPRHGNASGFFHWLTAPRTYRVTPLTAFAAAATLLLAAGIFALRSSAPVPERRAAAAPSPAPTADTVRIVQFVFFSPSAEKVAIVGDFNDWDTDATLLKSSGQKGVWTVSLPLAPGRHEYAYVVDDAQWESDPTAPAAVEDDFGTANSVVTVGASS